MYIKKEVYDALIGAHMREVAAMNDTIKAKDDIITALRRENQNLENRLAYNKAKAMEHIARRKPKGTPFKPLKDEDNRAKLNDADDPRNYDKEEHNPYPEE